MVDRKGVIYHRTLLQEYFKEITGTHVPEQELREEVDNISQEGLNAVQIISDLATKINSTGERDCHAFCLCCCNLRR